MQKVFTLTIHSFLLKQYNQMFTHLCKDYQITQIEIDVLAFLANNPEYKHARDIVNIRGISKAHVSIAIEKLTHKGYLERKEDPKNRRCNILIVQPAAKELVSKIQDIQEIYKGMIYQGFSEKEIIQSQKLLQKMYKNLGGLYE